jgi:hypothetical protein
MTETEKCEFERVEKNDASIGNGDMELYSETKSVDQNEKIRAWLIKYCT